MLASSAVFYAGWRVEYLGLMFVTILSCYLAAIGVERSRLRTDTRSVAKWIVGTSIAINLAVLFLFKYFGLFVDSWNALSGNTWSFELGLLLPVGISFYTFQGIGYVIDVYRGVIPAERSLARMSLFISFFPQLVAGPIERGSHLLPALRRPIVFRWKSIRIGLWLILWGLFKKLVIADRLALGVNAVYAEPDAASGGLLLLATYAFAFQIYCDFSGYSDMAIGSARLFGIELMQNFRLPYLAGSLRDFWARWHISLSTWFRDYLYIPLGGNRAGRWYWFRNILIVFVLSGLWHGANWTYLIWGAIHGLAIIVEIQLLNRFVGSKQVDGRRKQGVLNRSPMRWLRCMLTFHVVLLAWVFFRASDLNDAVLILTRVMQWTAGAVGSELPMEFGRLELAVVAVGLSWMFIIEVLCDGRVERILGCRPRLKVHAIVIVTLMLLVNFGIFNAATQFVYFQF